MSNRGNFEQVGVEAVVKGFDAYVKQMKELVGQTQKAGQQIGAASGDADKFGKSLDISAGSILKFGAAIAGAQLGVAAIRGAFSNTIGAAIDFESSFAGVRKTVDATEEEFAQLAQGFRNLAKEIPVNVNELNRIGEAAGQLGIRKEDILAFTETVAKLSATTSLTSDQAATDLARLANVVGFTADEFDNVASVIVALGNAGASTEPEILAFAERIAGAGKIAGLTIDQILAIGEAMSSVGIEAEAGGTAVQKVLLDITQQVETGGDKLALFASVAGMSAEQFAAAWRQDAGQAFTAFVEGLGRSGTQAFQILDELDLKEQRLIRSFLSLSGAGDLLRKSLDNASNAMKDTSAIDNEFAKRQETTAAQLQILQNRIADVGISVGQVLLPAINDAIGAGLRFSGNLEVILPLFEGLMAILPSVASTMLLLGSAMAAVKLAEFAAALPGIILSLNRGQVAAAGFAAAIIAIDFGLRKFTGAGLIDRLFGDVARMEASAAAAERFANALFGKEDPTDRIRAVREELEKIGEVIKPSERQGFPGLDEGRLFGFDIGLSSQQDQWKEYEETVKDAAVALRDNGATATELRDVYRSLSPDLQQVFLDTLGITGATLQQAAAQELGNDAVRQWDRELLDLKPVLDDAASATGIWGERTVEAATASDLFFQSLGLTKDELADTKAIAEAMTDSIERMIGAFASLNPEVRLLNAETALYKEEIADLKAKGDDLTQAEKDRIKVLEGLIEVNDAIVGGMADNETAMKDTAAAVRDLIGDAALGGLLQAMQDLKLPQEQQVDIMGNIIDVYRTMKDKSIPELITKLTDMKDSMDPEDWKIVAEAVGPAVESALVTGLGEAEASVVLRALDIPVALAGAIPASSFTGIGKGIWDGVKAGFNAGINAEIAGMAAAAKDLMVSSMQKELREDSPSKVMRDEVGYWAGQGIIVGIIDGLMDGEGRLFQVIEEVVSAASSAARRAAVSYSEPSGPAGTLPGYAQEVYDRDFPDDTSRRLFSEGEYTTEIGGQRFNTRFTPDGRGYIQLADGSWQSAGNLDLDYGGTLGANTLEDLIKRGVIKSAYSGETYVPRDNMLYALHRGEAVIPAASNPYASFMSAMPQQGGGDTSIVIDLSGATLTGSVQDNEAMLTRVVKEAISDQLGHGAFTYGVRRGG